MPEKEQPESGLFSTILMCCGIALGSFQLQNALMRQVVESAG